MLYLDNAATTYPKPRVVRDALLDALDRFGNPGRGAHPLAMNALRSVESARLAVAGLFNCSADRVAFQKSATEGLNVAIHSLDGHIISSESEHNAVLRPLYRHGNFSLARVDWAGRFRLDDIIRLRRRDTVGVVIAHGSNLTGNVHPIQEIGRWCRENGLFLVVDSAQTAGLVPLDMEAMCVDAVAFSGHKSLYGIQGTGGLCVGEQFPARPLIIGGSGVETFNHDQPAAMPARLEAGTLNAHGIAALAAGIGYIRESGPDALLAQAIAAADRFRSGLKDIDGLTLYGDYEASCRLPTVTLNIGDMDSSEVAQILADDYDIAIRGGAHCAPLLHTRFGTERQGAARFSFSHMNTLDDGDRAAEAVREIQRRLA